MFSQKNKVNVRKLTVTNASAQFRGGFAFLSSGTVKIQNSDTQACNARDGGFIFLTAQASFEAFGTAGHVPVNKPENSYAL